MRTAERLRAYLPRLLLATPLLAARWWATCLRATLAVGLLVVLVPAASSRAQEAPVDEPGPRIAAIELRADAEIEDGDDLRQLLTFDVGQTLTGAAVRRTLRNLHATGRFEAVEIYRRPVAVGTGAVGTGAGPKGEASIEVIVVLRSHLLVETIDLVTRTTGASEESLCLPEVQLREAITQSSGEPLSEESLQQSLEALQERYERAGYLQADVRLDIDTDTSRRRAAVRFDIDCGPRARVGRVRFDGDFGPFDVDTLRQQLQVTSGTPFVGAEVRDDRERLRRWLVGQGYRLARVDRPLQVRTEPSPESHSTEAIVVDLSYPLRLGPKVEVALTGGDVDDLRDRDLLPLFAEDGYDYALLLESQRRLRRYYQRKGHYRVRVDVQEEALIEAGSELLRVHIGIEPGDAFQLQTLELEGNEAMLDDVLLDLMATAPRRAFSPGSGRLVTETLQADLENLRSYYALRGFWQAQIGPEIVERDGKALRVVIPIVEGPRRRVASLVLEGLRRLEFGPWVNELPLGEGKPFHPRLLEDALEVLRTRYAEFGYTQVQISPLLEWIDETLVEVTLQVLEGPRTVVDRVLIRGNRATRASFLRRVVALDHGDPVSRTRLLEVERELNRLGIFSRVDVELLPGGLLGEGRDVVVRVEEASSYRLIYGGGYDSEDGLRGLFGVTRTNIDGRALTAQLDLRISQRDQRFRLLFSQPFVGSLRLPINYSLFGFDDDRESFQQRSIGLRVESLYETPHGNRFGLVYDYRLVDLDEVDIPLNEIEREDQEVQISSIIPALLLDRRDDAFDPTRGWSTVVQLQYAFPVLDADAHFGKLFIQQTGYLPFGRFGVLAASVRVGGIEPLVDEAPSGALPIEAVNPVPIGERFFAGGRTSHRAYDRDELGILGETLIAQTNTDGSRRLVPVGGNGLLLANLEYRFPLADALGGALFVDAGNVWRDWQEIDPSELSYGVGVGVRYQSPIGPVRLEVGWKLDRLDGESPAEVFLSLGNPF